MKKSESPSEESTEIIELRDNFLKQIMNKCFRRCRKQKKAKLTEQETESDPDDDGGTPKPSNVRPKQSP